MRRSSGVQVSLAQQTILRVPERGYGSYQRRLQLDQ